MDIIEFIEMKKNNQPLSKKEIDFIIDEYKNGKIDDQSILEFMKTVNHKNFSYEETYYLADALARTGDMLNLYKEVGDIVDKHNVGAYSDSSTLIYMSVLATIGVKNVRVLSKCYGQFRSTLERLEVFKGFNAKVSKERLIDIIKMIGAGVIEETGNIAPVDKKLYALRKEADLISIPLIASSILAQKIATGSNTVIYDVKAGEGAIAGDEKSANELAKFLVESSKLAGFNAAAIITNLDQPLGSGLGIRAEIEEMITALRSERSLYGSNLIDVARELVVDALCLTGFAKGRNEATNMFEDAILSGKALDKFREIIREYDAVYEDFKHTSSRLLDNVAISYITSKENGYVNDINIKHLVEGYKNLAGDGKKKQDKNASVVLLIKEGAKVSYGDKLVRIFYSLDNQSFFKAIIPIRDAIKISGAKPHIHKIFYKIVL